MVTNRNITVLVRMFVRRGQAKEGGNMKQNQVERRDGR
jgi:hypothetical protein